MSKRYLGIICLLYSFLFSYVVITGKIKNFLAPQMQIYIKLSIVPMLLIGIVIIFNKNIHYKFKLSDLILLLPIVLLVLAGDGKLSPNFASNRIININVNRTKNEEIIDEKPKEEIIENETEETIEVEDKNMILLILILI